jgi:L-seryl-tRNA(Ser) seleniumtransferase
MRTSSTLRKAARRTGRAAGTTGRVEGARALPSVHEVLERPEVRALSARHGRAIVAALLRERLDGLRRGLRRPAARRKTGGAGADTASAGDTGAAIEGLAAWLASEAEARTRSSLVPVINATGVVIHTNLGRAPLPQEALRRMTEVGGSYSTLEYDLAAGGRGSRGAHLERLFRFLFPDAAALVVNNNAAAVLLALNSLAEGREVIVSRGELVEIGGSFRIPEILEKSGAILREVGTTNKTRLADYERAIGSRTALLLKVHPSNYRIVGFTQSVSLADLARLGRRRRLPVLMDQGSGNLRDLRRHGLKEEGTVQEALRDGADLVCASGDKLLGGPQAGLLVGRAAIVERLRRNPLARALRVDKTILAALEAVLLAHVRGEEEAVPAMRMIALGPEALDRRAKRFVERLAARQETRLAARVRPGVSVSGGGSGPGEGLPSALVAVRPLQGSARAVEECLRRGPRPVVARIEAGELLFDLRTVAEEEEGALLEALVAAAAAIRR